MAQKKKKKTHLLNLCDEQSSAIPSNQCFKVLQDAFTLSFSSNPRTILPSTYNVSLLLIDFIVID